MRHARFPRQLLAGLGQQRQLAVALRQLLVQPCLSSLQVILNEFRINFAQHLTLFDLVTIGHSQPFQLAGNLRAYINLAQGLYHAGGQHQILQIAEGDGGGQHGRRSWRAEQMPSAPSQSKQQTQQQQTVT